MVAVRMPSDVPMGQRGHSHINSGDLYSEMRYDSNGHGAWPTLRLFGSGEPILTPRVGCEAEARQQPVPQKTNLRRAGREKPFLT
jgi:hypothetical protein